VLARGEYGNIPREKIEWFPRISQDLCTQCGACVEFCHQGVFASNDGIEVVKPYACVVGCTGCVGECPAGAIQFPTLAELRDMLRLLRQRYP
jgi:NAD-dependent dihydropyrimidine dehydrogenase PreA subunit